MSWLLPTSQTCESWDNAYEFINGCMILIGSRRRSILPHFHWSTRCHFLKKSKKDERFLAQEQVVGGDFKFRNILFLKSLRYPHLFILYKNRVGLLLGGVKKILVWNLGFGRFWFKIKKIQKIKKRGSREEG